MPLSAQYTVLRLSYAVKVLALRSALQPVFTLFSLTVGVPVPNASPCKFTITCERRWLNNRFTSFAVVISETAVQRSDMVYCPDAPWAVLTLNRNVGTEDMVFGYMAK